MTEAQLVAFAEILDMIWLAGIYAVAFCVFGGMIRDGWREWRRPG